MDSQNQSGVTGQSTGRQQHGPLIDLDLNLAARAAISIARPCSKDHNTCCKDQVPDLTDAEKKVLIGAKQHEHYSIFMNGSEHFSIFMNGSTQQKMTSTKHKWKAVAQFMQELGGM
ncbi:unnamed protein product [Calypogeia fissa]